MKKDFITHKKGSTWKVENYWLVALEDIFYYEEFAEKDALYYYNEFVVKVDVFYSDTKPTELEIEQIIARNN